MGTRQSPVRFSAGVDVGEQDLGLKKAEWHAAAWVVALAAALRFARLATTPLWYDEIYDIGLAIQPLKRVIASLAIDTQPPAYYLLLRASLFLFGENAVGVRWISSAAGILTVALLYLIGRRTADHRRAIMMALVLAVHPAHILLSQDGKTYALLIMLATLIWWQIGRLAVMFDRRMWFGWLASLILALAVNWMTASMWLGALLADGGRRVLFGLQRRRIVAIWSIGLCSAVLIASVYLAWSIAVSGGWHHRPPNLVVPSLHTIWTLLSLWGGALSPIVTFGTWHDFAQVARWDLIAAIWTALLMCAGMVVYIRRRLYRDAMSGIGVALLGVIVLLVALTAAGWFKIRMWLAHPMVIFVPAIAYMAGWLLGKSHRIRIAGLVPFLLISILNLGTYYFDFIKGPEWYFAQGVNSEAKTSDAVLLEPGNMWIAIGFFYHGSADVFGVWGAAESPDAALFRLRQPFFPLDLEQETRLPRQAWPVGQYQRVWLFGHQASLNLTRQAFGQEVEIRFFDQCHKNWFVLNHGDSTRVSVRDGCIVKP